MATHSIISSHPANKGALLTPRMSAILTSCGGGAIYGLGAGIIGGLSDPLMVGGIQYTRQKEAG